RKAALLQTLDDIGRLVASHDLRIPGFDAAVLERTQPGATTHRFQGLAGDLLHGRRLAVGLELQLVGLAGFVGPGAGARLDLVPRGAAGVLARPPRRLAPRPAHAVDQRAVPGIEQHLIDGQLVEIVLVAARLVARERDDAALVGGIVDGDGE